MVIHIQENSKMENTKDMGNSFGQMEIVIKDNTKLGKSTDTAFLRLTV